MFVFTLLTLIVLRSSTEAVDTCQDSIIQKLTECYKDCKPPNQQSDGKLGTHIFISEGELPSNTQTVTAYQDGTNAYVNLFFTDSSNYTFHMPYEPFENYLLETDEKGVQYRLYVCINEDGVYAYYRCIQKGSVGNGCPMGDIAVKCGSLNDEKTEKAVEKAKYCLEKVLGITNLKPLKAHC